MANFHFQTINEIVGESKSKILVQDHFECKQLLISEINFCSLSYQWLFERERKLDSIDYTIFKIR